MVKKSYVNDVRIEEVSIAIERMLIAEYPQTWTPGVGRVDLTPGGLPTGFKDLGAVVEDSPSLKFSRQKFTLSTGIPAVRQYEATTGLEGTLEFALHSTSWRKLQFALGNLTAISSATLISTVYSFVGTSEVVVSTVMSSICTVGDQITVALAADVNAVDANETIIRSIVTETASYVKFFVSPSLIQSPTLSYKVYRYDYVDQYYGTATQREFTLLGVADFIDGQQIVHEFPRCQVAGDFERNIRPGENLRLPLQFNLFAVNRTIRGNEELVIAKEVYYPKRSSPVA